jgi:glutathione S-transferase
MYKLYYSPGACSFAVHCLLEATGAEYQAIEANIAAGDTSTDGFLALNPRARVPVLLEGGETLREATALLIYLAEKFPRSNLLPTAGTVGRAKCLEWLSYLSSTLHPLYWGIWRQERLTADESAHAAITDQCDQELCREYQKIGDHLASRVYLLGDEISIADLYLFVFVRWGSVLSRKTRDMPVLAAYMKRLTTFPALNKTMQDEGIEMFRD